MKKIEFKKKAYQKPEIVCYLVENCLLAGLSGWNNDEEEKGGLEVDEDEDPFGGGK